MTPQPANSKSFGIPKIHCMVDAHILNTGAFGELDKKDILNLAIVSTVDVGEGWKRQIEDMERAVSDNPLRLYPLFCYDPRHYRYSNEEPPKGDTRRPWDEPFARIVECENHINGIKKFWLGFCVNPALGVEANSEFCECLPFFYEKCEAEEIPILVFSTPDDISTRNDESYSDGDDNIDPLYKKYGNSKNCSIVLVAIVLAHFPKLHLCLADFGGNKVWDNKYVMSWVSDYAIIDKLSPDKKQTTSNAQFEKLATIDGGEWIYSIILLTRNTNVYTDISGLDINNTNIRYALKTILSLAFMNDENYKHLKDKIIFGSGRSSEETSYSECCDDFEKLFEEVENDVKMRGGEIAIGEIWEIKPMRLILFLFIILCSSYAQSNFENTYVEGKEYYYNILLKEWLKDAKTQELKPTQFLITELRMKPYMTYREAANTAEKVLKADYNINLKRLHFGGEIVGSSVGNKYLYWLFVAGELPKKEQLWILCFLNGGKCTSLKEKIKEPEWKKVNLTEIRDNNVYTFLLKKMIFDDNYQCQFPQKSNGPNNNENIDSIKAIAIVATVMAECYDLEMTPVVAKLMGRNKEHWLVYCFPTIQNNIKQQETCYETAVNRYNDGLNLWNWSFGYELTTCPAIISVLISRKNGQVLFMETGHNGI